MDGSSTSSSRLAHLSGSSTPPVQIARGQSMTVSFASDGSVGAGGGFLIIPALVILANVEMKIAVATSLIIIAFKSLIGFFIGDALKIDIDWPFLTVFTSISLVGIFIGSYIGSFIDGKKLKKGFGYFIFVMAIFIFYMEFFIK